MKSKIFFLVILVAFVTNNVFSQDVITKRDNSEMKVKVIEIQESSIKYKPFDFLEGPMRSILLTDVLKIVYENGRIENFVQLESKREVPPEQSANSNTAAGTTSTDNSGYRPLRLFGRISAQMWHDESLSDFFGTSVLCGAGIEKQISDHFKIGANADLTYKTKDQVTLNYTQLGGFFKYSWGIFGSRGPLLYSQLGAKGIFLKGVEEDYSATGKGIGFSAILGLEIPIGRKAILDLGWDSVFSKITFEEEKINLGHEAFFAGVLFSF